MSMRIIWTMNDRQDTWYCIMKQCNQVMKKQEQTPLKQDLPLELSNISCFVEIVVTLLNCSQNFHWENFLV